MHFLPVIIFIVIGVNCSKNENIDSGVIESQELFDDLILLDDMLLTTEQYEHFFSDSSDRKGVAMVEFMWPSENGYPTIPYKISLTNDRTLEGIKKAINHWQHHTCIKFRKITGDDVSYIDFRSSANKCASHIGRTYKYYPQSIYLANGCYRTHTIIHEIGHAIGFLHEQMRSDRDSYIFINNKNIETGKEKNFVKNTESKYSHYNVLYDYTSVMHYGPNHFSKNGGLTLRTLHNDNMGLPGRGEILSHRDRLVANRMYGCLDMFLEDCGMEDDPCQNEGYIGKDCTCICASGTEGNHCQTVIGGYYNDKMSICNEYINTNGTIIKTPNYPNRIPTDTWCVYHIVAPKGLRIVLEFEDFYLHKMQSYSCAYAYLVFMEDSAEEREDVVACGDDIQPGYKYHTVSDELTLYLNIEETAIFSQGFKAVVEFVSYNTSSAVILSHYLFILLVVIVPIFRNF